MTAVLEGVVVYAAPPRARPDGLASCLTCVALLLTPGNANWLRWRENISRPRVLPDKCS